MGNVLGAFGHAVKVGYEINTRGGNGDGRLASQGTKLLGTLDELDTRLLHVNGQVEIGAEARHEVFRVHDGSVSLQLGLKGFIATPNLLLGNPGESADLAERATNFFLATGDEDAGGDDGVRGLATKKFLIFDTLVKLLSGVRHKFGERDGITHGGNLLVRLHEIAFALDGCSTTMHLVQVFGRPGATVAAGNNRVKLVAVKKRVCGGTHTGWVVAFVVGEGTPFGASVNDTVPKDCG